MIWTLSGLIRVIMLYYFCKYDDFIFPHSDWFGFESKIKLNQSQMCKVYNLLIIFIIISIIIKDLNWYGINIQREFE